MMIEAPVSIGELIDRITTLEVTAGRLRDAMKRSTALTELALLEERLRFAGVETSEVATLRVRLRIVNESLWGVEDRIRSCERNADFGTAFVSLARDAYHLNDERAALKQEIDGLAGALVVHEKSYGTYR